MYLREGSSYASFAQCTLDLEVRKGMASGGFSSSRKGVETLKLIWDNEKTSTQDLEGHAGEYTSPITINPTYMLPSTQQRDACNCPQVKASPCSGGICANVAEHHGVQDCHPESTGNRFAGGLQGDQGTENFSCIACDDQDQHELQPSHQRTESNAVGAGGTSPL